MTIKQISSGGGEFTLAVPASASNRTITLPDATTTLVGTDATQTLTNKTITSGTIAQAGIPAFSAYQSSAQSLTSSTPVKLVFQTEEFDTSNSFDSTTNYRFQPNVAGYYLFSGGFQLTITSTTVFLWIYKNGTNAKTIFYANASGVWGGTMLYLNGSTDYVELWARQDAATQNSAAGKESTYFSGVLVRAA